MVGRGTELAVAAGVAFCADDCPPCLSECGHHLLWSVLYLRLPSFCLSNSSHNLLQVYFRKRAFSSSSTGLPTGLQNFNYHIIWRLVSEVRPSRSYHSRLVWFPSTCHHAKHSIAVTIIDCSCTVRVVGWMDVTQLRQNGMLSTAGCTCRVARETCTWYMKCALVEYRLVVHDARSGR